MYFPSNLPPQTKNVKPLGKSHHSSEAGLLQILQIPNLPISSVVCRLGGIGDGVEDFQLAISTLAHQRTGGSSHDFVVMVDGTWCLFIRFIDGILLKWLVMMLFQYDYTTTAAVLRMMCFILSFCCKSSGMRHLFCHWGDVCSYE